MVDISFTMRNDLPIGHTTASQTARKNEMEQTEKSRRIFAAIAECDRFIDREAPRNADLRPADMQQYLDFCIAHKQKLIDMLAVAA